jgi:hypothetical protein
MATRHAGVIRRHAARLLARAAGAAESDPATARKRAEVALDCLGSAEQGRTMEWPAIRASDGGLVAALKVDRTQGACPLCRGGGEVRPRPASDPAAVARCPECDGQGRATHVLVPLEGWAEAHYLGLAWTAPADKSRPVLP